MEWERCTLMHSIFIECPLYMCNTTTITVRCCWMLSGCLSILISNTINLKTPNFLNNNYQMKVIKCHYHLIITVQPNIISNRSLNTHIHYRYIHIHLFQYIIRIYTLYTLRDERHRWTLLPFGKLIKCANEKRKGLQHGHKQAFDLRIT